MTRGRSLAAVAALVVGGVAACTAATPSATPASRQSVEPIASVIAMSPSASAAPSAAPDAGTLGDLGRQLNIRAVDPAFTARVLEFASTGSGVVASAAEARGDEAAPDLYFVPSGSGAPELVWQNPERDHSLVRLAGDGDTIAFVDMPVTGEAAWTLHLIPEEGVPPLVLDALPDDPDVPALVPSVAVYWPYVAWTAFDLGPDGPVSQLLVAEAPDWTPHVLQERPSADAELWFPGLLGAQLVYTELVYAPDRLSDERRVWLTDVRGSEGPRRLDTSGLATMPVINQHGIAWKEGDPGFHQLNWGTMERLDPSSAQPMPMWAEDEVNYPSAGNRFMTWWTIDPTHLVAWDGLRGEARSIVSYPSEEQRIRRPHVAGSVIAWLFVDESVDPALVEIRYALLP